MPYVIDLSRVTIADYRRVTNSRITEPKGDDVLAAAAGLTVEQVQALPFQDYRRLLQAFFKAAGEPLSDPN
jgi:hypothetical protein